MKTKKKVTLRRLTTDFVEVNQKWHDVSDDMTNVKSMNHMATFSNSPTGREMVKNLDIPREFLTGIFNVWGDEPTIADPEMPKMPEVKKQ